MRDLFLPPGENPRARHPGSYNQAETRPPPPRATQEAGFKDKGQWEGGWQAIQGFKMGTQRPCFSLLFLLLLKRSPVGIREFCFRQQKVCVSVNRVGSPT